MSISDLSSGEAWGTSQVGLPTLALKLSPFADESLPSLLMRLTEENILSGPHDILRVAGLSSVAMLSTAKREALEVLSVCLGIPISDLEKRILRGDIVRGGSVQFFGLTMRSMHFTFNRRRVSPKALKKGPYHRSSWAIGSLPYCTEEWEFLLDACPAECGRPLDWYGRLGPARCRHCGYDLRRARAKAVPETYRDAFKLLVDLVSPFDQTREDALKRVPGVLRSLTNVELLEFALGLGRAVLAAEGYDTAQPESRRWRGMAEGADLLLAFPASVGKFATSTRLNAKRSPFFSNLAAADYLNSFPAVRAIVDDVLREYEPILHGPIRLMAQREGRGDLSLSIAAEQLHLSKATMRRLADQRQFEVSPPRGFGRKLEWFSKVSVDAMAARLGNRQSALDFSRSYGMPLAGIEQLVSLGLLTVNNDPAVAAIYDGLQLHRGEVDDLVGRLCRCLRLLSGPVWSLADVFSAIGDSEKPWGAIVKALLDGSCLIEVGMSPVGLKLDELVVGQASGRAFIEGAYPELLALPERASVLGPEPDMTRLEVERYLNCFPRDVSWLMANGRLGRPEGARRSVPRGDVVQLGHELISSREITWRWRVSPTLREALPEYGIVRVAGPFWPRRQVADFFNERFPQGRPA
ncbi:hypothetical protein [Caulobacter segnis]|uniref:hypothetical protein n=1 Tax=Caulobacter segnis TaxID=88688 RepID=UPI001CC1A28B|nr:hypothetical protein [Caulobacter segnis]UAL10100.1 hypothetical protein K8940_20395 [Caulobacter segnis]